MRQMIIETSAYRQRWSEIGQIDIRSDLDQLNPDQRSHHFKKKLEDYFERYIDIEGIIDIDDEIFTTNQNIHNI